MLESVNLPLILAAAFVATASPGPATLAIAGTSLASGRMHGLALASGVTTGSVMWSVGAALGLSALMFANVWLFELMRYAGAFYLMWLAFRSARSALSQKPMEPERIRTRSARKAYMRGLALHLTNPKAILFFGSLYSIGIPAGTAATEIAIVIAAIGVQSILVFHGYAILFSIAPIVRIYTRLRRGFEAVFAVAFGAASIKILTARVN